MEEIKVYAFLDVFEDRLSKIKKKVKKEMGKPKQERDKQFLKLILKEAKTLRVTVRQIKQTKQALTLVCPHCNKPFELDKNCYDNNNTSSS